MSKVIGMPGWVLEGKYFGVTLPYIEFIERFGCIQILTKKDVENPPDLDLLVLPGGADIIPTAYGAVPNYRTGSPNIHLEHFDNTLLPYYIKKDTPIFGICRGAQKLWTMYGGAFNQHNPYHKQSSFPTDQCHDLIFTKDFKDKDNRIGKVTSRHHQMMDGSKDEYIPQDLEVIAFAGEKYKEGDPWIDRTVVEIFRHRNNRIYGVQYHPEDNHHGDNYSSDIIKMLLGVQ